MWKYINKQDINNFLLSLNLIDNKLIDKDKIKELYSISNNIEDNYKIFKIKKRNGKYRTIYEPNSTLKYIQRQILNNILNERKISKYAKAYHKGLSLKDNAIPHINKEIILKLDLENFFDNISFIDVYNTCFPIEYYPKSIGMLLTYLVTYKDHLTQGSPTSAYISNLVMRDFDEQLGNYCNNLNVSYTRYSDDMTFSGNFNPSDIIKKVNELLKNTNLTLNKYKIHIITKNNKQLVTGVIVNKKLSIDISYRKKIRQEIYYIKKYGLNSHLSHIKYNLTKKDYLNNLYGRILYVLEIDNDNKEFINYRKYIQELKIIYNR